MLSGIITLFEQLKSHCENFKLKISVLPQSLIFLDDLVKIIPF